MVSSLVAKTMIHKLLPTTIYTTLSPSSLSFPTLVKSVAAESLSTIFRRSFSVPEAMASLAPKTVAHKLPTTQTMLVPRASPSSVSFPTISEGLVVHHSDEKCYLILEKGDEFTYVGTSRRNIEKGQIDRIGAGDTVVSELVANLVAVNSEASTMDDVPSVKPVQLSKKIKGPGEIGEGWVVHTDGKYYLILEKGDEFMYYGTSEGIIKYCIEKGLIDGIGAGDTVVFEVVNDSKCLIIKLLEKSTESSREKVNLICRHFKSRGLELG